MEKGKKEFLENFYQGVAKSGRNSPSPMYIGDVQKNEVVQVEMVEKELDLKPILEEVLYQLGQLSKQVAVLEKRIAESVHAEENLLYTPDQVAVIVSRMISGKKARAVHTTTVLRWIKEGLITPIPGSHYRISGTEIKRFVQQKVEKKKPDYQASPTKV